MKKIFTFFFIFFMVGAKPLAFGEAETCTNSIGMDFIRVPAGSFMMGCDNYCDTDNVPQHQVTLTQSFYLGKYEVTQAQWTAVMGSNPSNFKGDTHPVEMVSWNDVQVFIRKLNQMEGTNGYRLPTEAEWEYAARAGTTTDYSFEWKSAVRVGTTTIYNFENSGGRAPGDYMWYGRNLDRRTSSHPVGQKLPNPWGFYDMHGNVWEWVADWRGEYTDSAKTDPKGPESGDARVLRGGCWFSYPRSCRSFARAAGMPNSRGEGGGFRLVLSPEALQNQKSSKLKK